MAIAPLSFSPMSSMMGMCDMGEPSMMGGGDMMLGFMMMEMQQQNQQMMMMMMMLLLSRQYQNTGNALPGCQSGYPQGFGPNPNLGYEANDGNTYSRNPGYGNATASVPNMGAGCQYSDYQKLLDYGRAKGSLDGTFITPYSSLQDDGNNFKALNGLCAQASDDTLDALKQAPPKEQELAKQEIKERLKEAEDAGINLTPEIKNRIIAQTLSRLHKEGKLCDAVGKKADAWVETLNMQDRAQANMALKWGTGVPDGTPQWAIDQSPFNPQRKAAS